MKTTMKILMSGLCVLALVTASCTKESVAGEIGPIGPRGEQGIQGEKGDKGDDGSATGVQGAQGEQGEEGPKGDTGAQGEEGPKGDTGATGPAGEDGNANVIVKTVEFTSADWLWNSNYVFSTGLNNSTSRGTRYVDLDVPEIDAEIDDNGLVLVYFKASSNGGWQPLPFVFTSFFDSYETHIVFETKVGEIVLHYFWTANQSDTPNNLSTYTIADHSFKYVIVQGNAIAKSNVTATDIKKMSYEEVMDYLGLER